MNDNLFLTILFITLGLGIFFSFSHTFLVIPDSHQDYSETLTAKDEFPAPPAVADNGSNASSAPILFLGDILLARNVELLMDTYGLDYPIADIKAIISQYESVVGNFESAMNPNHVRTKAYTTTFSVHNRYLTVLTELGVTHVSLANNHAYDFGLAGYENARDSLAQAGLAVFGHPGLVTKTVSTSRVVAGDRAISLIGLNAVFARPDLAEVAAVIRSIPERDLAVCYIHWGTEYVTIHTDAAAELAAELARAGCETIIGHHPHVTQDIQIIDGVPVFYSLGNFLFDQYFSADVEEGYMLSLEILDDGRVEFEILPITSRYQRSRPQLMDQADKERFLKDLARRSDPRWSEYILAGKGFFNTNLATSTQTSIISP